MKEQIRQIVKEEITKHLNLAEHPQDEQVNESLLAILGIAAIGAAWAWTRGFVQKTKNDTIMQSFLENYDKERIIEKKIPETAKRFKLIATLSDLEVMEKQVDVYIKKLKRMQTNVDKFVDRYFQGMEDSTNFVDKAFAMKPASEKARIKRDLAKMIENIENSFQMEIDAKTAELLD